MGSTDKEFEARADKADFDVNEKVKFRKLMKELKSSSKKAAFLNIVHIITEFLFFWSILAAAMVGVGDKTPVFMRGYMNMVVGFFTVINDITMPIIPYSFVAMMVFGSLSASASGAKTKAMTELISLLTFAEQKSLLFQMQDYVDQKVDEVKRQGGSTGRRPGQTTYRNPNYG